MKAEKKQTKQLQLPGTGAPLVDAPISSAEPYTDEILQAERAWRASDLAMCLKFIKGLPPKTRVAEKCGFRRRANEHRAALRGIELMLAMPPDERSSQYGAEIEIPSPIDISLLEAREIVAHGKFTKHGVECSACLRLAKVYRRSISAASIRFLIRLNGLFKRDPNRQWARVSESGDIRSDGGGDYAKMRWAGWGLIEQRPGVRPDGSKNSGYWRVTARGKDFIDCILWIPKYVFEYDGKPIPDPDGAKNPRQDIVGFAGGKFSYAEIMAW